MPEINRTLDKKGKLWYNSSLLGYLSLSAFWLYSAIKSKSRLGIPSASFACSVYRDRIYRIVREMRDCQLPAGKERRRHGRRQQRQRSSTVRASPEDRRQPGGWSHLAAVPRQSRSLQRRARKVREDPSHHGQPRPRSGASRQGRQPERRCQLGHHAGQLPDRGEGSARRGARAVRVRPHRRLRGGRNPHRGGG